MIAGLVVLGMVIMGYISQVHGYIYPRTEAAVLEQRVTTVERDFKTGMDRIYDKLEDIQKRLPHK